MAGDGNVTLVGSADHGHERLDVEGSLFKSESSREFEYFTVAR